MVHSRGLGALSTRVLDLFFTPSVPEPYAAPTRRRLVWLYLALTLLFFPGLAVLSAVATIPDIIAGRTIKPAGDLSFGVVLPGLLQELPAAALAATFLIGTGDSLPRLGLTTRWEKGTLRSTLLAFVWLYVVGQALGILIGIALHALGLDRASAHVDFGSGVSVGQVLAGGIPLAISAGIVEEIVVLGFAYRLLERLGWSDRAILITLVCLRLSYHVYYGLSVLVLLPWAYLSVLWYRRYRRLWPLIAAHAIWDTVAFAASPDLIAALALLVVVVLAVVTVVRWRHVRRRPLPPLAPLRPVPQWRRPAVLPPADAWLTGSPWAPPPAYQWPQPAYPGPGPGPGPTGSGPAGSGPAGSGAAGPVAQWPVP